MGSQSDGYRDIPYIPEQFICSSLGMISTTEMIANLCKKYCLTYEHSDRVVSAVASSSSSAAAVASSSFISDQNFTFNELCAELNKIANQNNVQFLIYHAEHYADHKEPLISGKEDAGKKIYLYYCGGGLIRLLKKKSQGNSGIRALFAKQDRANTAPQEPEQQMNTDESTRKVSK